LRDLPARERSGEVDVRFELDAEPGKSGAELLRLNFGRTRRAVQFAIDPAGHQVWANWRGAPPAKPINDVASLLLGPILGGLLRLRRTVSVHACVLEIDSGAVVLLGGREAGKSTIAAAMAQRGHAVLSDDIAAILEQPMGTWMTQPGYPRLRLGPTTIEAIDTPAVPATDAGPVITGLEKRYLELSIGEEAGPWRFQCRPLPLEAIYELRRGRGVDGPVIEPIVGADRLTTLVRHLRAAVAPLDAPTKAAELARLGRLATSVPVRRVTYPDDLEALPALCQAIAGDAPAGELED
jgi:hypothetical protein